MSTLGISPRIRQIKPQGDGLYEVTPMPGDMVSIQSPLYPSATICGRLDQLHPDGCATVRVFSETHTGALIPFVRGFS